MVSTAQRRSSLALGAFAAALSCGCYDLKKEDPGVALTPDANGVVDVPEVGIVGRWYAYGDQYDHPRRCVAIGHHLPESCSTITTPDPLPSFAAPQDGAICISGKVAKVISCLAPNQVECLLPSSGSIVAGDSGGVSGTGDATEGDPEQTQIELKMFSTGTCTCQDPSCVTHDKLRLSPGESCACPPPPVPFQLCNGSGGTNGNSNDYDYSNIWGAGLGLDFHLDGNLDNRNPLQRTPWDPKAHGIIGVAFDFSVTEGRDDADFLRVEFPIRLPAGLKLPMGPSSTGPDWIGTVSLLDDSTVAQPGDWYPDSTYNPGTGMWDQPRGSMPVPSEEHPSGSPFWRDGSQAEWATPGTHAVRRGHNVIHFGEVNAPPFSQMVDTQKNATYTWDPSQLLGIQFHVPSRTAQADAFSFCISNLTLIRN